MIGPESFIATEVIVEEVDSTNDLARRMLEKGDVNLPLLILARRQTRGRGQGSNTWWSDDGSLTFTLAIDPAASGLAQRHEPLVALTTALAVIQAIDRFVPPTLRLGVRWPNDIEVGGKKLGGLLTERVVVEGKTVLLIGVGLNVKTRLHEAPGEIRAMAASLADFGPTPESDVILRNLLERTKATLDRLSNDDSSLATAWAEADLLLGQPVRVQIGERLLIGVGHGIDDRGALRVATETGIEATFAGRVLRTG